MYRPSGGKRGAREERKGTREGYVLLDTVMGSRLRTNIFLCRAGGGENREGGRGTGEGRGAHYLSNRHDSRANGMLNVQGGLESTAGLGGL